MAELSAPLHFIEGRRHFGRPIDEAAHIAASVNESIDDEFTIFWMKLYKNFW